MRDCDVQAQLLANAQEASFMQYFAMLRPTVTIDGNMYCVLYGENLQEGIAGFGKTITDAIGDFNKQFTKPIK